MSGPSEILQPFNTNKHHLLLDQGRLQFQQSTGAHEICSCQSHCVKSDTNGSFSATGKSTLSVGHMDQEKDHRRLLKLQHIKAKVTQYVEAENILGSYEVR